MGETRGGWYVYYPLAELVDDAFEFPRLPPVEVAHEREPFRTRRVLDVADVPWRPARFWVQAVLFISFGEGLE